MRYLASVCALLLIINAAHAQDAAVPSEEKPVPVKVTAGSLLKEAGSYLDSVAEEMAENEDESRVKNDVRFNAFGVPDTIVGVMENQPDKITETKITFPDCDDERLLAETRRLMDEYQTNETAENIHQYRRQRLVAKNMGRFTAVDVSEFKPRDNYEVADRMITLKINDGIPSDAFRICRGSNSVIGREIFLLMYPAENQVVVEVLNFTASEPLRFSVQ